MAEDIATQPVEGSVVYGPEGAAILLREERVKGEPRIVVALARERNLYTRQMTPEEFARTYRVDFTPAMNDTDRARLAAEHSALADTLSHVEATVFAKAEQLGHRERTTLAADVYAALRDRYRQRLKDGSA